MCRPVCIENTEDTQDLTATYMYFAHRYYENWIILGVFSMHVLTASVIPSTVPSTIPPNRYGRPDSVNMTASVLFDGNDVNDDHSLVVSVYRSHVATGFAVAGVPLTPPHTSTPVLPYDVVV
jgi:hypothetical protein